MLPEKRVLRTPFRKCRPQDSTIANEVVTLSGFLSGAFDLPGARACGPQPVCYQTGAGETPTSRGRSDIWTPMASIELQLSELAALPEGGQARIHTIYWVEVVTTQGRVYYVGGFRGGLFPF